MIYVDLSVASSPQHLLAALFVARVQQQPLVICVDDLNQLYWRAAGLLADPGYNEQYFSWGEFFVDHRKALQAALPENPALDYAGAGACLLEKAIANGWAELDGGNWGSAEFYLRDFVNLPRKLRSQLRDWDATLREFNELPEVRELHKQFQPSSLDHFCQGEGTLITAVAEPDLELRDLLLELGKADGSRDWTKGDFLVTAFTAGEEGAGALSRCTTDLRHGALVGMEIVLNGDGEHFTRASSVQTIMEKVATGHMPLLPESPRLTGTLAKPLLRIGGGTRVEDAFELLANARTLEMFSDLLDTGEREREASTKTYVNRLVELFTPRFAAALRETIQFIVRRRRL